MESIYGMVSGRRRARGEGGDGAAAEEGWKVEGAAVGEVTDDRGVEEGGRAFEVRVAGVGQLHSLPELKRSRASVMAAKRQRQLEEERAR